MGILLTVAYDGTNYSGWQIQPNGLTIYEVLQKALIKILNNDNFKMLGASRTDAGVHALGQRAHIIPAFDVKIPLDRLPTALNSLLPDDIAVTAAASTPDTFHPIKDATSKTYIYKIFNDKHRNPLATHAAYVADALDFSAMTHAASYLVGKHDFAAFCAAGSAAKSTIREIFSLNLKLENNTLEIYVNGNGFLYNMVRIIAGTLVEVGLGKLDADAIPAIISSKNRTKAGKTMPACGLTLLEIFYLENLAFIR